MKKILTSFFLISSIVATAQSWESKQSLPAANRHHPVTFVLNDQAFLLTGMDANNTVYRDFYVYDYVNDSWTKKTDFPGASRSFAYGTQYEGKGYMGFGMGQSANPLNDLWEYDPGSDTWTQLTSCPCTGRRHPAFLALNGKIFVGLGDNLNTNLNDWWEYDIALDEWSQAPAFPGVIRHHPYYFAIEDDAYVGFGHGASIYKDFYKFNTNSNSWTRMQDFPGEARVAGTQQGYGGKGYILAGDGFDPYHQNMATGEFWEYDPTNDSWTQLTPHPGQSRWAPGSFILDGKMFLVAGETGNGILHNDLWSFDLGVTTGIDDVDNEPQQFSVYPNPADNEINIPNNLTFSGNEEILIYSAQGNLVGKESIRTQTIDISRLPNQLYFVQIQNQDGILYQSRFVKR